MAKIAIDAGHGLNTAGKRCLKKLDPNETREWVLNDRVADALCKYLKNAGHTILRVDDADGSSDISLTTRVKSANNWKADAYISVHHNAGINGGSGGGTVVYVAKSCSNTSVRLQDAVYKHAIADCNLKGNRYDGTLSSSFYVCKNTKMPAILIEVGFMDSTTDIKYILDEKWSEKMGCAIAKGVCDIFGGTIVESEPKKETTTTTTTKKDTSIIVGNIDNIREVQYWANVNYNAGLAVDGSYGSKTKKALIKILQTELNQTYKAGLAVDGSFGSKTKAAISNRNLSKGTKNDVVKVLQAFLVCNKIPGVYVDGSYGNITVNAVKTYQKKKGLKVDGIAGKGTFTKLCA